jgi:hypothetical protein
VGESSLKEKKKRFGRGGTVELYSFVFKLKIDVPDYRSDLREEFSRLEPDISSAGSAREKIHASLSRHGAFRRYILAQRRRRAVVEAIFILKVMILVHMVPFVIGRVQKSPDGKKFFARRPKNEEALFGIF